ncbi:MAG: radical SAM protein, partial [Verrucomicrobiae bacterium]|nr:radical SAM protein [Verrucomicrobiae bacterium]
MNQQTTDIVLTTLNARYTHCAFGLRYLYANLGTLRSRAKILEFNIHQRPLDIAETILAHKPKIVGFGVYIWNVTQSTEVVAVLKRLRPDLTIVLGGPEVSYAPDLPRICELADKIIPGEADLAFAAFCRGDPLPAAPPNLAELALPYDLYTDEDIAHRTLYVEASRGCPFKCEFCLSSLDPSVRRFPLEPLLSAVQRLFERGALRFKFVDRTFNLDVTTATTILEFFLERYRPGMFLHFEMIPDRFPPALRKLLQRFPPGVVQLEIGLQTFNEEVAARIGRRQDNAVAESNLRWLREQTGVHLHTDLVLGLPGETLQSIAVGFDRLVALRPHIIQVGILKRLRGAPIV